MKSIIVSVTNDLETDQRVKKVCRFLSKRGFDVTMVGVIRPYSKSLSSIGFSTHRFKILFQKGFLFYAEYNIRLLFYLLNRKSDILVSNDLDTLLPNYLVSRLKRKSLVYDSHEYFLGSTEIQTRKVVKKIWETIERSIFPHLKNVITVNESIANLYKKDYGIKPIVVHNFPPFQNLNFSKTRKDLGLPENKKIVLMQGSAINIQRGAEELIKSLQPEYGLDNVHLLFIGGGDVWEEIQKLTNSLNLKDKITFLPRMPFENMMEYTRLCDLGISIDKPVSINYQFSLPNKLFDYIAAGLPVLVSPLAEVKKIVENYNVGLCIEKHEEQHIASMISRMFADQKRYNCWKKNTVKAHSLLNWEREEEKLKSIYDPLI
ncbi:MAG: glycosyltransferase [Bacteroidales bacterium]